MGPCVLGKITGSAWCLDRELEEYAFDHSDQARDRQYTRYDRKNNVDDDAVRAILRVQFTAHVTLLAGTGSVGRESPAPDDRDRRLRHGHSPGLPSDGGDCP